LVNGNNAIDRAIAQVARELIAGEPSPAFRVRVIARLDERRPIRRSVWLLSPIAVAAIVLIVLALRTPPSAPRRQDELAARAMYFTVSVPDRAAPPLTVPIETEPPPIPVAGQSVVAALAPPPLEVASLMLTEMPVGESIEIPELETIAPITVAPIGEPQGGPR
jgi:hypothetical protein